MSVHLCPNCSYEITEKEYEQAEENFLCPKCFTKRISVFREKGENYAFSNKKI